MSYPEVYIIGRQVDGVYVEYLHGAEQADLFFDYTIARDERNHMNKTNMKDGTWKILKYGRPITVELNNKKANRPLVD
ncbi:hypothetical protein MZO26_010015 [Enterococcus faecalis]|uniref:hypothetical protein n=1 Tax=Enterococcus faecalis TaxID=1351 RepID=UPI00032E5BA6|nr:hypothetical protein [Enterococcus faecalis]EOL81488.1 hypothetical protein UM7_02557 [Enterococcus faecalis EnGen0303]MBO6389279.1 hypothetical protein [Enterococcus faecalis]MBO6397999.1 hypothetical protein [Enterococcus faecalis]MBO6461951.1 hypothetical protein [Enterococcus faecalis]MCU2264720.1 hypothetical protein [Enterococcus faecalis]